MYDHTFVLLLSYLSYSLYRSISSVYAHVNAREEKKYSDYEHFTPTWRDQEDDYEVMCKVGRGKFSEVFAGVDVRNLSPVIVKILKPIPDLKIQREIKVLQTLKGGPNIINLIDTIKDSRTQTCSYVFEYVNSLDFKVLYPKLQDNDVRYYMYELLRGLDYAHSKGIMHRDIKPHNVVIDHEKKLLRIIDWYV